MQALESDSHQKQLSERLTTTHDDRVKTGHPRQFQTPVSSEMDLVPPGQEVSLTRA